MFIERTRYPMLRIVLRGTFLYDEISTTIYAYTRGWNCARATETDKRILSRRDEPPIIRAGIRVKIIEGRERTKGQEDETRRVGRGQEGGRGT